MTIAFIHGGQSFLPEVDFYRKYFEAQGIQTLVLDHGKWSREKPNVDVEWVFMGTDSVKTSEALRIHEYASASTPPFRKLKDNWKKIINIIPHYRLFLNSYVKNAFAFRDEVPWGYRDMGVGNVAYGASGPEAGPSFKEYDFVYTGSLDRRGIEMLFNCFTRGGLKDKVLLVLSQGYESLRDAYLSCPNIIFKGPVPHDDVARYLQKCRYGINFIPDQEPYCYQTSTKFLEYLQAGLPVITTDYAWVRQFMAQYGGNYFFLRKDLSNLDPALISHFPFEGAPLEEWTWESQLLKSGVLDLLEQKFPSQTFRAKT